MRVRASEGVTLGVEDAEDLSIVEHETRWLGDLRVYWVVAAYDGALPLGRAFPQPILEPEKLGSGDSSIGGEEPGFQALQA